jgi:glycosyltransferase involved in cell wall biosynthesis
MEIIGTNLARDAMDEQTRGYTPLVSVCPITYNHAKHFSQAVESILSQQVDFEFEIIVGEDESSDGTREIALEYQRNFPDKIKVLLHSRKDVIYVNGRATGRWNFVDTLSQAHGKYIALLSCDDFWTDPHKLQKQVDVMEAHPEYSVCGHWTVNVDENGDLLSSQPLTGKSCPEIFSTEHALNGTPLIPNSWLFRRFDLASHPQYSLFLGLPAGDDPLMLMLLGRGLGYCIRQDMSAYRIHSGGTWSTKARYHKDFEMLQFHIAALQLAGWRCVPKTLVTIYQSVLLLFADIGREAIDTRSLFPFGELLRLLRIQKTMPFYFIVPLFLTGCILLPVKLALRLGRKIVSRLRILIGKVM